MSPIFLILTVLMLLVIFFDATRFLIPNWLVGMVAALYPVMIIMLAMSHHHRLPWLPHALTGLGVFAVGYLLYMKKLMGGGDIKLLAACSLWVGVPLLMDFLLITALLGGVLALALLVARQAAPQFATAKKLPKLFKHKQPMPYGLAIAGAFLLLLWLQQIPTLALLH